MGALQHFLWLQYCMPCTVTCRIRCRMLNLDIRRSSPVGCVGKTYRPHALAFHNIGKPCYR